MSREISQITFAEISDFEFRIQFAYSNKVLVTKPINRTATEAEILQIIRDSLIDFDSNYNEQAFNEMITKYSGKTLVID